MADLINDQGGNTAPELAGLIAQAGQIDGEAAASTPEAMQAAQELQVVMSMAEQNAAAVGGMLELALPLIGPMYPSLETIYTPDVRAQVAATLGPLLAKYGVNLEDMGGRYREEIAAAFVCGPIAIATYKGIKADIEARAGAPKALVQNEGKPAAQAPVQAAGGAILKPGDYGYVEAHGNALAGA
jgi:hypothetical protein